MDLQIDQYLLTGFLLAVVRAGAWLLVIPPLNSPIVPVQVRVGLATTLAVYAAPVLAAEQVPVEIGPLIMAGGFQVVLGLSLGFLVNLLFSAIGAAGELIDIFGGISIQPAFDPMTGGTGSGFARIYQTVGVTLLFAVGGHLLIVRGFIESFKAIGVSGLDLTNLRELLIGNLGHFLLAAVEIAAPIIAVAFLIEVGQGLVARAAPQMNVFLAVMPLKILVTIVIVAVALPLLPGIVSTLVEAGVSDAMALGGR
ncbi:flagellar biosynthetic protein FliR [Euzebya sp.]|uniref:flagellar biosynthetic protein FliR n=1 Tax=Euzebya sp. TaxID=1971409 RepID=UPI0035168ABB